MNSTYLLIDLLTLLLPFAFSFHPRIRFVKCWGSVVSAIGLTALVFAGWDTYFTRLGVWRFNPRYLTGVYVGNLPVEEWLFFLCIPFACLFTLYFIRLWSGSGPSFLRRPAFTWLLIGAMFGIGIWKIGSRYTASTFLSLSLLLLYCQVFGKIDWLGRFYAGWSVLLIPLLLVDGLLTGTGLSHPVVIYNESDIIGIRIATIPIEDFFYGMELILLNALVYDALQKFWLRRTGKSTGVLP